MNKVIVAIAVIVLIFIGLFVFTDVFSEDDDSGEQTQTSANTDNNTNDNGTNNQVDEPEVVTFTAAEVATHNSEADCWTIIDGNVYDITEYVPRHPGGDEILAACGTDGSSLFNERTTSDGETVGSGTPHSSSASSQLASFQVGTLTQ